MKIERVRRSITDAWLSLKTGMGSSQDRTRQVYFAANCQRSEIELANIYRHNWLARRIVDALPDRALARGVSEETPWPASYAAINNARGAWTEGAFLRAARLGRLYGGAGLYLGYATGPDLTQPAAAGAIVMVDVFTRYDLQCAKATIDQKNVPAGRPEKWPGEARDEDPASPTFGDVLVWEVVGQHPRQGLKFHTSRMLRFGGVSRPPDPSTGALLSVDPKDRDWSDSVLLALWDDVRRYGTMWANIDQLIDVASIGVLKQEGMLDFIGGESEADARARVDIFNAGIANGRLMLLQPTESYERQGVTFGGIPELLQELQLATAGAVNMPVTELFGRAPAGMNATGEADLAKWYAAVAEYREHQIQAPANAYATALAGAPTEVEFEEIAEPSEKAEAEIRNLEIQGTERLWTMGVFSDQEVRNAMRAGKLVEDLETLQQDVPKDPTRAVVQIRSETANTTEAAPEAGGNAPPR